MVKTLHSRNKNIFSASQIVIKHYTYGYFLADNGHLTSFATSAEKKLRLAGTENLSLQSLLKDQLSSIRIH